MNKKGPFMESLIDEVFYFFAKIVKKNCFEQLAKNSSLTGDISAVFSKFTTFPVAIVG